MSRFMIGLISIGVLVAGPLFANPSVYTMGDYSQTVTTQQCSVGEGCSKKLNISGIQTFTMQAWDFTQLEILLSEFGTLNTVFEADLVEPFETDVIIKVNGNVVGTEKIVKECVKCKKRRRDAKKSANIVYSNAFPGQTVTFEFVEYQATVTADNFTLNAKRFRNDDLTHSISKAFFEPTSGGGGGTHIP